MKSPTFWTPKGLRTAGGPLSRPQPSPLELLGQASDQQASRSPAVVLPPGSFWSFQGREQKKGKTPGREPAVRAGAWAPVPFSSKLVLLAVPGTKPILLTRKEKNRVTATKISPKSPV